MAALEPSTESLLGMIAVFRDAMARGLAGRQSSLKMLPTFVHQPRGDEQGCVAVADWGGTHSRVALVELCGRGRTRVLAEDVFVFSAEDKTGSSTRVFDVIASAVERILGDDARDDRLRPLPLGFAYSFPARLERIDRAIALPLTKGWSLAGLEGRDVAGLLEAALTRRGLGRIKVSAVVNDTVAALALTSYRARRGDATARPAEVGLIVGTGTNQAADLPGHGIRNLESGNFDGVGDVATSWDAALDCELTDPTPGAQRFEKMAAGRYLGEILRRIVADLGRSTSLFRWPASVLRTPFGFDSAHLSRMAGDDSDDLSGTEALLRGLGVASTRAERRALADLARGLARRAARLIAAGLLGTLTFIDHDLQTEHTIAVDGSLYGGYPGFGRLVSAGFRELVGAERARRLSLAYVKDSTGAGAAIIAAAAARD